MVMKRICTCLLAAALVVGAFTGCAAKPAAGTDTTTKQETTTETTTVTTTENTKTTFRESYTSTIYPALHRKGGSGYSHELASYTTYYDAKNETRTANITASIRKLNNLVIPAGRTFSFNQTVGKRTVLAGYATAKVVQDGEFVDGLGGGVCQVSSTIFECILRANLQVVSRAPHSLEISYVPLGGDATVQWNTTDFQFKNTSGTDIRLQMTAKNGTLTCKVMGQKNVKPKDVKSALKNRQAVCTHPHRRRQGELHHLFHLRQAQEKSVNEQNAKAAAPHGYGGLFFDRSSHRLSPPVQSLSRASAPVSFARELKKM